ncbi:MAG: hypothetical protein KKA19_04415 [Candidatus Margulisbacteria bacterium]|nr:hypothetical protein [Candidatus Margulisiibacteriota bacterium]
MKNHLLKLALLSILAVSLLGCSASNGTNYKSNSENYVPETSSTTEPIVKKSTSGICHEDGSTYYDRTKNFTPYDSIDECLDSGGRLPKR